MVERDEFDIFEEKAPEILTDLAKHVEEELAKQMPLANARQVGIDVARRISQAWGGSVIYMPRGILFKLSERDIQIWRDFTGNNHQALARKYGVSEQWVYQIVKKMRKEEIDRLQPDLFGNKKA